MLRVLLPLPMKIEEEAEQELSVAWACGGGRELSSIHSLALRPPPPHHHHFTVMQTCAPSSARAMLVMDQRTRLPRRSQASTFLLQRTGRAKASG